MEFRWVVLVIISIFVYACVCWVIKKYNFHPEIFAFMGPCLMIRTSRIGIFDVLSRFRRLFLVYGTLGIIVVVICGILMTLLLILTSYLTMLIRPCPYPIIQPQNLLLIPGVNDFVPSTFAVWFALMFAAFIHEFGHGLLSRVENIRIRYAGLLSLVIPIGAFVEPDDKEIEKSSIITKLRIYAAGITNNVVFGVVCIVILSLLLGMVMPGTVPFVQDVYENYPADLAGIQPRTVILAIDETHVANSTDVSVVLAKTASGQKIRVLGEYGGKQQVYEVTLTSAPPGIGNSSSGFMGVVYGQPQEIVNILRASTQNLSLLLSSFMSINDSLSILVLDTPNPEFLSVPFCGFWEVIHVLYWCALINILLGVFNSLPLGPLDGGQMLREGVMYLLKKCGMEQYTQALCSIITNFLIVLIFIPIIYPYFPL